MFFVVWSCRSKIRCHYVLSLDDMQTSTHKTAHASIKAGAVFSHSKRDPPNRQNPRLPDDMVEKKNTILTHSIKRHSLFPQHDSWFVTIIAYHQSARHVVVVLSGETIATPKHTCFWEGLFAYTLSCLSVSLNRTSMLFQGK